MIEPTRTAPDEVRRRVSSGQALLVCAYDDEKRYARIRLEGSISYNEFAGMKPSLPRDREIITYCE